MRLARLGCVPSVAPPTQLDSQQPTGVEVSHAVVDNWPSSGYVDRRIRDANVAKVHV